MSLREALDAALTTGLGSGFKVIDYPATLDGVSGPTVALWATEIKPLTEAPNGHYQVDFTVQVLTAHQDPARADDDLDASMAAVLAVLWNHPTYLLTQATRTVSEDNKIHSWTLTVSTGITITEG